MRNLDELGKYRLPTEVTTNVFGTAGDANSGAFRVRSEDRPGITLIVIASAGLEWDHVSVTGRIGTASITPTWLEMAQIKRLFFLPDETAMQLHVAEKDHINCHANCLHLWRPHALAIPRPPAWMVA